jgi:dTDP-4-dehydrorhamnose reductase
VRILCIGSHGQLARALTERGAAHGIVLIPLGRPELDLTVSANIESAIARVECDIIVNTAAYTAVDQAETEQEIAFAVNARGAELIAAAAKNKGIPFIHLSTDYVFDGGSSEPYREEDPVAPINAYGRSKLAGEIAVQKSQPDSVIIRTAWVYSPYGTNFIETMLRLAVQRDEISVVADQHGSPTSALDLADAVFSVARNLIEHKRDHIFRGVFHMVGAGSTTWAEFAAYIFEQSRRLGGPSARIRRISAAEYPALVRRPLNSRLNTSKLAEVHGITLPHWHVSAVACVQRLVQELAREGDR